MKTFTKILFLTILLLAVFFGLAGGATSSAQANENQARGIEAATMDSASPSSVRATVPGGFTFYAVYEQLTDTDTDDINVTSVAMSGDGNKLIFAGLLLDDDGEFTKPKLYTMNIDGSNKKDILLPPEVAAFSVREVAIDYDGSFAFFNNKNGEAIYRIEGQTVTKIIDAGDYPAIDWCNDIKTTFDGSYVFFRTDQGQDIWRVPRNGDAPVKIVEDTEVPRVEGVTGYQISYYDISADGSVVAFIQPAVKPYQTINHVFVKDGGGYRQLTQDTGVLKQFLALSGDGRTIVFRNAADQKWYAINVLSEEMTEIADANIYSAQPVLTYAGDIMFEYVKNFVYTNGSGGLDLFPGSGAPAPEIPISATYERNISDIGDRVAFIYHYQIKPVRNSLYVGHLNAPGAVPTAPVIHWNSFNPPAMPRGLPDVKITFTARVNDPQGLDDILKTRMDTYLDGRFEYPIDCPVYVKTNTRDDGVSPDIQAGDGLFTTWGEPGRTIDTLNQMTVRMSVLDASKTIVVADKTLFIFNPQHNIGAIGGTITSSDGDIKIEVPAGAVADGTVFTLIPLTTPSESISNFIFGGNSFQLTVSEGATGNPITTFDPPLIITTYYDESLLGGINADSLRLNYWNEDSGKWQDALCPGGKYTFNFQQNWFSVPICHLSEFAVLSGGFQSFLPLLIR